MADTFIVVYTLEEQVAWKVQSHQSQVDKLVIKHVREQVWDQVWDQVSDQVERRVGRQVGGRVRDQVKYQVIPNFSFNQYAEVLGKVI